METTEEWLPVVGYEGLYEVSSEGRVKSLPRKCNHPFRKNLKGRFLRLRRGTRGHLFVALCKNKSRKYIGIHRLVLLTFIGECPEGMEACHNNGIPNDNRLSNLRWDTRKSNVGDQIRHGVFRGIENIRANRAQETPQ